MKRLLTVLLTVLLLCTSTLTTRVIFADDEAGEEETAEILEMQEEEELPAEKVEENQQDGNAPEKAGINKTDNENVELVFSERPKANTDTTGSSDGEAYAVLTSEGELIFFRSDNLYSNNVSTTVTDIFDNTYTGTVYANIEAISSSYSIPWDSNRSSIISVRVAEGQIISPVDMDSWFSSCKNMTSFDASGFDTSKTTSMTKLFYECNSLKTIDLSSFDTSNVNDMSSMFESCYVLESVNLTSFNTKNVTGMYYMFGNCYALKTIDLSSFDTSKVTNMAYMFWQCSSLESLDLRHFNTSKVTDMQSMFASTFSMTSLKISGFDTSNVTNMSDMFWYMKNVSTLDVSSFRTPKVTSMYAMFSQCSSLTALDLSRFDTSNVTTMTAMFDGCSSLKTLNLSNFDTSNVTEMPAMFYGCKNLTSLDVSGFKLSNVSQYGFSVVQGMFEGCTSLTTLKLNNVDTSSVTDMSNLFKNCESLVSLDLGSFNTSNVTDMSELFCGCSSLRVLNISGFDTSNVTDMSSMFCGCESSSSIDISNFDTSKVTDMSYLFADCTSLRSLNINGIDTSNVTNMEALFSSCLSLASINTNVLNTANVTKMGNMFAHCESIKSIKVDSFNTSKVTDMSGMFSGCKALESIDLRNFDTAKLNNISRMFWECTSLKSVNLSGFDTSKVTKMYRMFSDCSSIASLDLSGFNTSRVNDMENAFNGCSSLKSLNLSNFDTTNVKEMQGLFENCTSLESLDISGFDTSNVQYMSYMFEGDKALVKIHLGPKFTVWNQYAELPQGEWKNAALNLSKSEDDLVDEYPSHATEWAGWWTRDIEDDEPVVIHDDVYITGDYTWKKLSDNEALIIYYSGSESTLQIPSALDGFTVSEIETYAFYGNSFLKRVIFPETIKYIGYEAFRGCSNLLNAEFHGPKPAFGTRAFADCNKDFAIWYKGSTDGWPYGQTIKTKGATIELTNADGYPCYYDPGHLVINYSYSGDERENNQVTLPDEYVNYSDEYFTKNSTFNYDLAKLSLEMAMASTAFPTNTDQNPSKVASDSYIRIAMETAGFTRDYYSYRYNNSTSIENDEAYAVSWKMLPDGTPLVALAIRSSGYGGGWHSNFVVEDENLPYNSAGFYRSAEAIVNGTSKKNNLGLMNYLAEHNILNEQTKIWVFGFSRGGAIANCIGHLLSEKPVIRDDGLFVYTFATPRTVIGGTYAPGVYNIVQEMDVVPQIPLESWGFTRYGTTYSLPVYRKDGRSYALKLANMREQFANLMGISDSIQVYRAEEGQEFYIDEITKILTSSVGTKQLYGEIVQGIATEAAKKKYIGDDIDPASILKVLSFMLNGDTYVTDMMVRIANNYQNYSLEDWALENLSLRMHIAEKYAKSFMDPINSAFNRSGLQKALCTLTFDFIEAGIESIKKNNDSLLTYSLPYGALIGIVDVIKTGKESCFLMQHWPEEYLCWLQTGYKLHEGGYKRSYVHCPVDVTVYDSNNEVVAQVINEEIIVNDLLVFLDAEGGKEIIIPEDDEYRIEITSREDDATMSYVLTSYDSDGSLENRELFLDIPLSSGQEFTSDVEAQDNTLVTDGETIDPDVTINNVDDLRATLNVETTGNGLIIGDGTYNKGDMVTLHAIAEDGNGFVGWFNGSERVSSESSYTFIITEDRELMAVFAPLPEDMALNKDYLTMVSRQSAELNVVNVAEEWLPYVFWSLENSAENTEDVVIIVEEGNVTAINKGTAWAVASLEVDGEIYSARCRFDVLEGEEEDHPIAEDVAKEVNGVSGVRSLVNKATIRLFSTDYAKLTVIPELTANNKTTQSNSLVIPPESHDDSGNAIESACFSDELTASLFDLHVVDDRTLEIIPKENALNDPAVKSKYVSAIDVTVDGTVFTTGAYILTIQKNKPSVKVSTLSFNTYKNENTVKLSFNGGNVKEVTTDPDQPLPAWLRLNDDMTVTYCGEPNVKKSAKITLLLTVEGWSIRQAATVSVKTVITAPKLVIKPASVTLLPASNDKATVALNVTPALFDEEEIYVSRITETVNKATNTYENGEIVDVKVSGRTAEVSVPADVSDKVHTYTVYLNVAGKESSFKVKTIPANKAVTMSLKSQGTIDLAVIKSPVTITADMKNFHADQATFSVSSIKDSQGNDVTGQFAIDNEGNVLKLRAAEDHSLSAGTYEVTASADTGSQTIEKAIKIKVKASAKVPAASLTLKSSGNIDVLRSDTSIILAPTIKNCYDYELAAEDLLITKTYDGASKTKVNVDVTADFAVTVEDGRYVVSIRNADNVNHTDKYTVQAKVANSAVPLLSKAMALKVIQGKNKVTADVKTVTLIKTDRYSNGIVMLKLNDATLNGIDRVELTSPGDKNGTPYYDLVKVGRDRYALSYHGHLITNVKGGTVKLNVFLKGNHTAVPNAKISIKIQCK